MATPDSNGVNFEDVYYSPQHVGSFGGIQNLKRALEQKGIVVDKAQVREWLQSQKAYTLFRDRLKQNYPTVQYKVSGIDQQWSIDLADMQSLASYNEGFKYIICVIDVFSKFAWAIPIKSKSAQDVTSGLEQIFIKTGRNPIHLNGDEGKEFVNSKFKQMLRNYGVNYIVSYGQFKAAVAERFIRTLKSKLWRYFNHFQTWNYINVLDDFLNTYNNTFHNSIRLEPSNVSPQNSNRVWQTLYRKALKRNTNIGKIGNKSFVNLKPKFKVGDVVRISTVKSAFEKGYLGTFQKDYFVIAKVFYWETPIYYKLREYTPNKNGEFELLFGIFYEPELQKITFSSNQPPN